MYRKGIWASQTDGTLSAFANYSRTSCRWLLTQEERHHLRRGDALVGGDMVREPCKAGPYRRDHHLDHIPTINRLDRKPEHGQYHPRHYSH